MLQCRVGIWMLGHKWKSFRRRTRNLRYYNPSVLILSDTIVTGVYIPVDTICANGFIQAGDSVFIQAGGLVKLEDSLEIGVHCISSYHVCSGLLKRLTCICNRPARP